MDLRRRTRVIGSITDGKPLTDSFALLNFGVEWTVKDYAFAPSGTLVWLCEDKVLGAHSFEGEIEAFLIRAELATIAPEGTDSLGLASMDFMIVDRRGRLRRPATRERKG